jgi:hypothetical protein
MHGGRCVRMHGRNIGMGVARKAQLCAANTRAPNAAKPLTAHLSAVVLCACHELPVACELRLQVAPQDAQPVGSQQGAHAEVRMFARTDSDGTHFYHRHKQAAKMLAEAHIQAEHSLWHAGINTRILYTPNCVQTLHKKACTCTCNPAQKRKVGLCAAAHVQLGGPPHRA